MGCWVAGSLGCSDVLPATWKHGNLVTTQQPSNPATQRPHPPPHLSLADALTAADDFAAEILISDIEMPGDDGIALLHELRERSAALPAIAVTGYADAQSRTRIMAAGFNGFVAKPLDPHALASEVQRALRDR